MDRNQSDTKSPVKIAILLPSLAVGGAERLILEELKNLQEHPNLSFCLHLVFEKGLFFPEALNLGMKIYVWNAPHRSIKMLLYYSKLLHHLRHGNYQILHVHLLNGIGPILGRLAGTNVITTVHSDIRFSPYIRLIMRLNHAVIACGQRVKDNISQFLRSDKVYLLNNAISPLKNYSNERAHIFEKFGIPQQDNLLVSIGSLRREKGHDILLRSFKEVLKHFPNTTLLIAGDGPERSHLLRLAEQLDLGKKLLMPGVVLNIDCLLSSACCYINSSRYEGLPITLLEASSLGKPIIATNVGGNPEIVQHNESGLLVSPEDPNEMARAIIFMLENRSFRQKAGKAGAQLYKRNYGIRTHCAQLCDIYLRICGRTRYEADKSIADRT